MVHKKKIKYRTSTIKTKINLKSIELNRFRIKHHLVQLPSFRKRRNFPRSDS